MEGGLIFLHLAELGAWGETKGSSGQRGVGGTILLAIDSGIITFNAQTLSFIVIYFQYRYRMWVVVSNKGKE